jgi:hypothetical protein
MGENHLEGVGVGVDVRGCEGGSRCDRRSFRTHPHSHTLTLTFEIIGFMIGRNSF